MHTSMAHSVSSPGSRPTPHGLAGWTSLFDAGSLPVLTETAVTIDAMRPHEDAVDAHALGATIGSDPLMTLKLLSHVGFLRRGREGGEPETVTAALVMLGIPPFFRAFGPQETVEVRLRGDTEALEGFQAVLQRAHRAATFALGFAVQRLDHDAALIHLAALLHDFAELLLWLYAPHCASEIARRQRMDAQLRSVDVQRDVLGVTLPELQHELMLRWHLPRALVQIADDSQHRDSSQARNVLLAVRLARHTAQGWDNAALPDDLREIAELLHLAIDPTLQLLRDIDA